MDLNLKGKTALVCGSTQGIGKACALELAGLGARVILMARNTEALEEVLKELDTISRQIHGFLVADFSNPGQVKDAIQSFVKGIIPEVLRAALLNPHPPRNLPKPFPPICFATIT
jgi:3-oxoacyl-[acyl-carrier protein] reductase